MLSEMMGELGKDLTLAPVGQKNGKVVYRVCQISICGGKLSANADVVHVCTTALDEFLESYTKNQILKC